MRRPSLGWVVTVVGLASVVGGCCCPPRGTPCCPASPAVAAQMPAVAAIPEHHFIGDLVLARLEQRSKAGMDAARAAVVAAVRGRAGDGGALRAWWSVLHAKGPSAWQSEVGSALAALREEAGGEPASVVERHDVAAFLKQLPVVTAMGPDTEEVIPREATLFEAIYFDLGLKERAPGPSMHLRKGVLVVSASKAQQAAVAEVLQRLKGQVADIQR